MDTQQTNREHRAPSKRKVQKDRQKKEKDEYKKGQKKEKEEAEAKGEKKERKLSTKGQNPKAFVVSRPGKMQKQASRTSDKNETRLHVPMVNRTPDDDPPPVIVAVVGPPGTGKTTLIRSLLRRLTKSTINDIKGPITVVSGKKRRLTFIECSNDMNSMVDIAKIADLVLLLMDGNFGFEMETMEFLNIAQHHGMPRVLGVTTHLDLFKKQSTLRASKKLLKQRFWTEVYPGAKLFYLSGVMNGRYPDREILNLTRFISVMKFRPLKWRNEHPYLLGDRILDLTHPKLIEDNPKCDRKVAIYGYLHGTALPATNARVHIPGVGDYTVSNVEKLPDPCPTPFFEQKLEEYEREQAKLIEANGGEVPASSRTRRRKRLDDKQKVIYAPMSDINGVLIDKDAVYIDVGKESFKSNKKEDNSSDEDSDDDGETHEYDGLGERLVTELQNVGSLMEKREQNNSSKGFKLFSNGPEITEYKAAEDEESEDEEDEEEIANDQFMGDSGRKQMRNARVHGKSISEMSEEEGENDDDEDEEDEDAYFEDFDDESARSGKNYRFDNNNNRDQSEKLQFESDSEFELSDNEEGNQWQKMGSKLNNIEIKRTWDINKLIYMNNIDPADVISRWKKEEAELSNSSAEDSEEDIEDDEDDFFQKKGDNSNKTKGGKSSILDDEEGVDSTRQEFQPVEDLQEKWVSGSSCLETIKKRFFLSPKQRLALAEEEADEAEELYGDFEDLEDGDGEGDENDENDGEGDNDSEEEEKPADDFADFEAEELKDEEIENDDSDEESDIDTKDLTIEQQRELNAKRKEKLRQQFEEEEEISGKNGKEDIFTENDTWYEFQKAKMAKQLEINQSELKKLDEETRQRIEGYKSGSYVKLTFDKLPMEFIENFNPLYPLVVGGLLQTEERFGYLNVRVRRHRWHKKILKSNDPLILSLGWRRFQTLPIYTTSDSRTRNRMLKYTPEHAYCFATFYGPLVAPNTTFCGFNNIAQQDTTRSFRISATGVVEDLNADVEIVKKLKLVGVPYKIFRNTAFIKDMFSSALEVAKFEGASIKTVSGIRGEIKRALSKPEGHYRATFEDKILLSDIIFLKTWYPVQVKKFYNPVTSLLLKDKDNWKGMRLTGQVRYDNGIATPMQADSAYQKVERQERKFNPLKVPKSIRENLPFKSQIHEMKKQKKETYMSKRAVVLGGDEKKARTLIQSLETLKKDKDKIRYDKKHEKNKERLKKMAKLEEIKIEKDRERKKEYFQRAGKKRKLGGSENSGAFAKKRH